MKLERFKKNTKKRNTLLTLGLMLIILGGGIILYRSYALYQEEKTYNVLKGKVGNFVPNDIELSMTLDGETVSEVPIKQKYKSIEVVCDNGATGEWDIETWTITIGNINNVKTKCAINFVSATEYTEDILNGADPVLADNLIPVTIANDGTVKKADIATEWYNYGNKVWANAVILYGYQSIVISYGI